MNILSHTRRRILMIIHFAITLVFGAAVSCKPETVSKRQPRSSSGATPETLPPSADQAIATGDSTWQQIPPENNGTQPPQTGDPTNTSPPSVTTPPPSTENPAGSTISCFKEHVIQDMQVVINGATSGDISISSSSSSPKNNSGIPGQLTFEFNTGVAHTEIQGFRTLFSQSGSIRIPNFSSYRVEDIKYIKISLGGHTYRNERFTVFDFLRGEKVRYRVTETNSLAINSVSIRINGREFYKNGTVNKTLSSKTKNWADDGFATNLVTKRILEENCEVAAAGTDGG